MGEKVVYPNHGVSVVEKIGEGFATGPVPPRSFYHLRLLSNNSKVMVPIGNTDLIGLRRLTQRKDITGLDEAAGGRPVLGVGRLEGPVQAESGQDEERPAARHRGRSEDAQLHHAARKTLSFREKKMYERAKYLIVSEIAVINGLDEQEVERQVDRALPSRRRRRAAPLTRGGRRSQGGRPDLDHRAPCRKISSLHGRSFSLIRGELLESRAVSAAHALF